jgi:hypothetical protein
MTKKAPLQASDVEAVGKRSKPKRKSAPKLTNAEQHARFVEAAKIAEADESPNAMDRAFSKINPKLKPPKKPSS